MNTPDMTLRDLPIINFDGVNTFFKLYICSTSRNGSVKINKSSLNTNCYDRIQTAHLPIFSLSGPVLSLSRNPPLRTLILIMMDNVSMSFFMNSFFLSFFRSFFLSFFHLCNSYHGDRAKSRDVFCIYDSTQENRILSLISQTPIFNTPYFIQSHSITNK